MAAIKYKILNQTNPEYEELQIRKLQLLYEGGHEILEHANLFIPKEGMESPQSYMNRLQCSSYKNYFSEIVNSYTAEVFNKTLSVMPASDADDKSTKGVSLESTTDDFYQDFAENADLKGTSLVNLLKSTLSESMVTGKALLQIDFPKSDIKPLSLIEEEELGTARAYLIPLPTLSMIDWSIDETAGTYNFCVIKSEYTDRTSLEQARDMKTIRFKVWQKEPTGIVTWKVYELKLKINKQPKPDDEFLLIEEGTVSFPEIPIICLQCPQELWVGNLIGYLCADHFKRYSSLIHAENRSLFSIPVYQQGPEVSSSGDLSELAQNPYRGSQAAIQMRHKGFAVTGPEDKIYFAEPDGKSYQLVNDQLNDLVDEIHRVTHLMANSISGSKNSVSMSGLSKIMDNRAKEIVLTAYGEVIKAFVIKLYKLISAARNEPIMWAVLGLDEYRLTMDRDQLLKEATSLQLINIPSKTFKKALYTQIATQFIDSLTPQEQLVIQDEISKGIDSGEDELYGIEQEDDGTDSAFDSKSRAKPTKSE
jgi:hypothetical protein